MFKKPTIIVITFLVAFVFVFSLVFPKKDALSDLEKRIKEKKRELAVAEDYSKEIKSISNNLANYKDQLDKIKLALPEGPQPLVFYNFLQKATSRAGLVLKSISHNEKPGEIYLNLAVSGSMDGFRNFLSLLEKSARMINVESFSFSSAEKEKDPIDFNLKIKANFIE